MATPSDLKYTKSHEWIKIDGDTATVGLTEFAVKAIQDVVFLELPAAGSSYDSMKPFGVIESVKAVFDLNAPLGGEVLEANEPLQDAFEDLISDPFGKGWLIKLKLAAGGDESHLLDAAAYDKHCAAEEKN